jgi:hypothetical protein
MAMWLRQSTASQEILLGKFVDSTDGNTAETALTIANTDIKLWVEGATTLANKTSGGATHISNGYYSAVLDATDTATLGKMEVTVDVTGALAVRREFMVVPAMVYDSLILGSDVLQADVTQFNGTVGTFAAGRPEVNTTHWGGTAVASATVRSDLINIAGAAVATGTAQLGVNVVNWGATAVASANVRANVVQIAGQTATAAAGVTFPTSIASPTNITAATGVTLAAVTHTGAVIPTVTTTTTATNLTNLPSIPANWLTAAGIATGAITAAKFAAGAIDAAAIATDAIDGDALAASAGTEIGTAVWATAARTLTAGTNIALAKGTGVTGFTDLDAAGVATAVWNAATATYGSAGSYGLLVETNLDAAVSTASAPTAAAVADAVWDEVLSGHLTGGSTGNALNAAGSAGDPWSTSLPGAYSAGSAGHIIGNRIDAAITSRLAPTVASRTLDVTATGAAGIDWANVEGQGTTVALTNTSINAYLASGEAAIVAGSVWNYVTRILTAGTNIVLAKGTGVTGFTDLDAAGVRTAVGLASANLDTQLTAIDDFLDTEVAAIKAKTDNLPAAPAATGDIPTTAAIADKILGRSLAGSADGGRTVQDALRFLRNRFTLAGGTLTVYAENDSTVAWTSSVTTNAAADPVTGSDPA